MKKSQKLKNFHAKLKTLNDIDSNTYVIELRSIVINEKLFNCDVELECLLNDDTKTIERKFAYFYSLLIIARTYNNYSQYNYYVDKYGECFSLYKVYNIVLSTYYRNKAILGQHEFFIPALKYARKACNDFKDHISVQYHYTELVALASEESNIVEQELITNAIEKLQKDIIPHCTVNKPKYYCTLGRLYTTLANFTKALHYLKKAVDLENGKTPESLMRIGQYNMSLIKLTAKIESKELNNKIATTEDTFRSMLSKIDAVKTQYLEYLAFFSSILAFILATVSFIGKIDDFNKCAAIIFVFAGSLIVIFNTFRTLLPLPSGDNKKQHCLLYCYITGAVFIILGCLIGNFHLIF